MLAAFQLSAPVVAAPPAAATQDEYPYTTQSHDTLIGLSHRLLKDPTQWRALKTRNAIADPLRIPIGHLILIPRDWLRQEIGAATVTTIVGTATGASGALQAGQVLGERDRVDTAAHGYVTLTLPDGSVVTLNESSTLALERLVRYTDTGAYDTRLKLEAGSVATRVKPQGSAGRFEIRTPVAVSAVRGTEFRREFQRGSDQDATEVIGGTVAVAGTVGAVVVPTGFGTISDASAGPRAPVKLLPPPMLTNLPARFDDAQVRIAFEAVPGAAGYRTRISADQEFRQIVSSQLAAGAAVAFDGVADGHYWLSVRSVDADGLEGPDAVQPFDRRQLPPAPATKEPLAGAVLVGTAASFSWAAVPAAASYRLQVARESAFADLAAMRDGISDNRLRIEPLPPGTYVWRVASVGTDGRAGPWSATQSFRQKPVAGTIGPPLISAAAVDLSWSGEPAHHFLVQLATDPAFATVIEEVQSDSPRARFHRPPGGNYYARFRIVDPDGSAEPFSDTRKFFVPVRWWGFAAPLLFAFPFL